MLAAYLIPLSSAQIQIPETSQKIESLSTYSALITFTSNSSFSAIPSLTMSVPSMSNYTNITFSTSITANNTTSYATVTSFQPSTHTQFSDSLSRNLTNSTTSTKATQTAPYPDDSIGKYGRLHISSASHNFCRLLFDDGDLGNSSSQRDDLEEGSSTPFMSFTPKTLPDLNRRQTQKRNPPSMIEFMTEFEQERRVSPPSSPLPIPVPLERYESQFTVDSRPSFDDNEDFSDTAGLTANASAMPGRRSNSPDNNSLLQPDAAIDNMYNSNTLFSTNVASSRLSFQSRPGSRLYEPAHIDARLDQKHRKIASFFTFDKQALFHAFSRSLRQSSRRVVDIHNLNSDTFLDIQLAESRPNQTIENEQTTLLGKKAQYTKDATGRSDVTEAIPLTRTFSNSSARNTASSIPPNPKTQIKETKHIIELNGNSLRMLSPSHPLRLFFAKILCWKWLETFIMALIVLHGVVLLIVGWGTNPDPVPPIAHGFLINSTPNRQTAFFRHSWNRVDFVAVISYWIDLALLCMQEEIISDTRRILVFKMLSALILLRLLNLTDGNRVILNSLKKAAPLLVNVLFFVLFFFVISAIVGVQSFKGSFKRHCVWYDPNNSSNIQVTQQYCGGYTNETGQVVPYKFKDGTTAPWSKGFICENGLICEETENPFGGTISFDNIFESMLIVMIITGVQSWTDRMYDMMDAEYSAASLYFIFIVIIMNFWLINLFIAVITEMFAKVREDSQHSAFTSSNAKPILGDTNEEEGWTFTQEGEPIKQLQKRESLLLTVYSYTKPLWLLLVAVDLLCMAAKNVDMSPEELSALDTLERAFSIAFLFEIFFRMLSQRRDFRGFFKDKMNLTDFLIAVITCIILIPPIRRNNYVYVWFTGFQVLRIYRLVAAVPRLRRLMSRVLGSLRGLINLTFFIIFVTILCAIIAYQLFEGVIGSDADDSEMRFFSVYNSFVGLNQLFSGEDWTTVLYNVMEAGAENNNSAIYALFLVLWFSFSNFVLVNLFIAVLMENFEIAEEDKRRNQVENFMKKTENELDKKTVVSRWNIYRYFKPKSTGLNVKNMPNNLVLSVQKSIVREFMNEAVELNQPEPLQSAKKATPDRAQTKVLTRLQNFLTRLFIDVKENESQINQRNRTSTLVDPVNMHEQAGTFYDFKRKDEPYNVNEPRSLRYLVDPSLRETMASRYQQETTDLDIEERKALKRDFIKSHPSYDKSLYIFSHSSSIRKWCQLVVTPSRGERVFGTPASVWGSIAFLTIITCCVIANVVLTIYNSPVFQYEHRNNPSAIVPFTYADYAFTAIFTIEFIIKVIADGFFLTPNAYLLNGWNILDLFVLVTMYMSNFGHFAAATGLERGFRAFKALRALRLINLLGSAKETFTSILVTGLPRLIDAAVLGLCIIIPFALYGQNIFMGLFYLCNDDENDKAVCVYEDALGTQEPMPDDTSIYMPRVWTNPYVYSFDSFWSSLLILFEIASGEGWIDVLTTSMSITGKDMAPQADASQLWGIYFMVYNLAGSVFVISLFLGVVIENFTKRNGTAFLTSDQRRWLDLKKLLNQIRPAKRPKTVPQNPLRKVCYDLTVEKRGNFYKFMTGIILLNIAFLCADTAHDNISTVDNGASGWSRTKVYIYLGFTSIYLIEIMIKVLGLGWNSFRRNSWNLFDLVMVAGSIVTSIVTLGNSSLQVNVEFQKLFMTALCFKLVQRSDGLNQLFTTMAASSYQILNVFAVWLVVMITYAIMFMQIFGLTKYGPQATTEHINFRTFSNTMISLVRYSTGEGWNSVMHDFTVEYPDCVVAENYLDSDCGSLSWAYFLFLSFNIISMYIFIAIFVAVVADNFSYVYQIQANFSLVNRDEIRKYPF
ncbi:Calcium-channel protein cch1 [Choanephora cucurbitarum]|uniref:Calcium-channel protein CCH1 n=1 Tax=Choanephora cucurbitarum TaxID=101091 RepID=A0A1C7NNL1_9FUNG|nr:Calcium-channel protein cch1 [Choanephora cucurbitarum]